MATTRKNYVRKCQEIRMAEPDYEVGKSSKQKCDCIGMTKYGLRENGVDFSTSGTNYTFRKQVINIRKINSANDLEVGDVVFKYREPGEPGYNLPAKYNPGGAEYNGDLNDYYHIGTVESVNPLQIIHMTTPTAKTDTKIGKWKVCASLDKRYISDAPDYPDTQPEPVPEPEKQMVVFAENGKPVNMRIKPGLQYAVVDRVQVGQTVTYIREDGTGWAYIKHGGKYGWMLECYLVGSVSEPEPEPEPDNGEKMTVWADNGKPVKLRQRPSVACRIYDSVPCNETVTLVQYGDKWCQVNYKARKGWYMMTKFLKEEHL